MLQLFTKQQNCRRVQIESIAEDIVDVNAMKISLSDMVENIVGKGENAGDQHVLLIPQCFPQCFQEPSFSRLLFHYHTMPHFDARKIYTCGKHCEKRRNCL